MRDPAFWWRPAGAASALLTPLAAPYGAFAAWRMAQPGTAAGVPVLCIGNLTVGGAGKTPTAIAVARMLIGAGKRPGFLSRGYGGRLPGPVRVDPAVHVASDVGDEPLLLARIAPAVVARDRIAGARAVRDTGADVIVMDDGFQNPALAKDLSILVVDGLRGVGNGRVLPAGPLRAPLPDQLARAQAILAVGPLSGAQAVIAAARERDLPVFHARLDPDANALTELRSRPVLAFAGIGHPDKFFATLVDAGIDVRLRQPFPDHHRYRRTEVADLMARAQREGLVPVTTEKDLVRLAGEADVAPLAAVARALPISLVVEEEGTFRNLVLAAAG